MAWLGSDSAQRGGGREKFGHSELGMMVKFFSFCWAGSLDDGIGYMATASSIWTDPPTVR
jgi:hypothetical protein